MYTLCNLYLVKCIQKCNLHLVKCILCVIYTFWNKLQNWWNFYFLKFRFDAIFTLWNLHVLKFILSVVLILEKRETDLKVSKSEFEDAKRRQNEKVKHISSSLCYLKIHFYTMLRYLPENVTDRLNRGLIENKLKMRLVDLKAMSQRSATQHEARRKDDNERYQKRADELAGRSGEWHVL